MEAILVDNQGFTKTTRAKWPPEPYIDIPTKIKFDPSIKPDLKETVRFRRFVMVSKSKSLAIYEEID